MNGISHPFRDIVVIILSPASFSFSVGFSLAFMHAHVSPLELPVYTSAPLFSKTVWKDNLQYHQTVLCSTFPLSALLCSSHLSHFSEPLSPSSQISRGDFTTPMAHLAMSEDISVVTTEGCYWQGCC